MIVAVALEFANEPEACTVNELYIALGTIADEVRRLQDELNIGDD